MVAATLTPGTQKMPGIAMDAQGLATAVESHAATGMKASPRQLAQAHAASVATLDTDSQARALIAAGRYTSKEAVYGRAERAELRGQWTMHIGAQDLPAIYSLRTTDGGAVTWYGLQQQRTFTVASEGAADVEMVRDPTTRALSGGRSYSRQVTMTSAGCYLGIVPPAAATSRKAAIVGHWWTPLGVRGT